MTTVVVDYAAWMQLVVEAVIFGAALGILVVLFRGA